MGGMTDWKHDGVRVIPAGSLDTNTAQTPGMNRAAAINFARVGAQKLWAGTVTIHAHAKTGAHHHGHLESVIYVVKGRARMRWGDKLQFIAEAGPGDFIYVPPYVPHQEINASDTEPLECVLVRSDNEAVAINIDIEPAEKPERSTGSTRPIRIRTSTDRRRSRDVRQSIWGTHEPAVQAKWLQCRVAVPGGRRRAADDRLPQDRFGARSCGATTMATARSCTPRS